jgi:hypothetical protein
MVFPRTHVSSVCSRLADDIARLRTLCRVLSIILVMSHTKSDGHNRIERYSSSLLVRHDGHVPDSNQTIFSIVEACTKRSDRRSSRSRSHVYELVGFEQARCVDMSGKTGLYIGKHKGRFHVVMGSNEEAVSLAMGNEIEVEEKIRRKRKWVCDMMTTLSALTISERTPLDTQYNTAHDTLSTWARDDARLPSISWCGSPSSCKKENPGYIDPCILCEMKIVHEIPILYFDIQGNETCSDDRVKSFAKGPIHTVFRIACQDTNAQVTPGDEKSTSKPKDHRIARSVRRLIGVIWDS